MLQGKAQLLIFMREGTWTTHDTIDRIKQYFPLHAVIFVASYDRTCREPSLTSQICTELSGALLLTSTESYEESCFTAFKMSLEAAETSGVFFICINEEVLHSAHMESIIKCINLSDASFWGGHALRNERPLHYFLNYILGANWPLLLCRNFALKRVCLERVAGPKACFSINSLLLLWRFQLRKKCALVETIYADLGVPSIDFKWRDVMIASFAKIRHACTAIFFI